MDDSKNILIPSSLALVADSLSTADSLLIPIVYPEDTDLPRSKADLKPIAARAVDLLLGQQLTVTRYIGYKNLGEMTSMVPGFPTFGVGVKLTHISEQKIKGLLFFAQAAIGIRHDTEVWRVPHTSRCIWKLTRGLPTEAMQRDLDRQLNDLNSTGDNDFVVTSIVMTKNWHEFPIGNTTV